MLSSATGEVALCSAFIRSEALRTLLAYRRLRSPGKCLVRWLPQDLLMGASDFNAFDVANEHGLQLYMRTDFHGKVFLTPPAGVLVGSANLTSSGLAVGAKHNLEVTTVLPNDLPTTAFVQRLFRGATLVTAALREQLELAVQATRATPSPITNWPSSIQSLLCENPAQLTLDSCFASDARWIVDGRSPVAEPELHDASLLGLNPAVHPWPHAEVLGCLRRSAVIRWLRNELLQRNGVAYFGQLSDALHNALSDDPSPRRREVKELLGNLQNWISAVEFPDITADRPSYSTRFLLRNS